LVTTGCQTKRGPSRSAATVIRKDRPGKRGADATVGSGVRHREARRVAPGRPSKVASLDRYL
jgi:hypothetical protein